MTKMTPETRQELPLMPYGEGSRTCALACLEVLDPKDATAQWIRAYLEHTAALEAHIEALEKLLLEQDAKTFGIDPRTGEHIAPWTADECYDWQMRARRAVAPAALAAGKE